LLYIPKLRFVFSSKTSALYAEEREEAEEEFKSVISSTAHEHHTLT
jgi:hypothetical protein